MAPKGSIVVVEKRVGMLSEWLPEDMFFCKQIDPTPPKWTTMRQMDPDSELVLFMKMTYPPM